MPDYLGKCKRCGEWRHRTALNYEDVCRECREAAEYAAALDDEFMYYLTAKLRGQRSTVAPLSKYQSLWLPGGRLKLRNQT